MEPARASACDESVDRTFLSRSVNPVEFPVEIRPKFSGAARGAEAPTQPIGLAAEAVCLQRVYSDALKGHFQSDPRIRLAGWGRFREVPTGDLIILSGKLRLISQNRTQMRVGRPGAREILSGIGISLRAPETPRPPPPETWRVNIDDVRME